jgi:hypothetical protein
MLDEWQARRHPLLDLAKSLVEDIAGPAQWF